MAKSVDGAQSAAPGWVDCYPPAALRPYLKLWRLDKPIGAWLLLWPCWWSIALAAPPGGWPNARLLMLFGLGAFIMRGAGCVLNDIVDRDFDAQVTRTASRPLPSGAISVGRAWAFMAVLLVAGLIILLQLNRAAIILGAASLPIVVVYPFMKRITHWPQAVLGLAFNWGVLLGWTAVTGSLAWPAGAMYAAGIAWTLGYDTIYAHQDRVDDAPVGVKSSALKLGERTRPWLYVFFGAALALLALAGALAGIAWPFYLGLAAAAAQAAWQAATLNIDSPADCLTKFRANNLFGAIVFAAIIAGRLAG
jgi:4-hydroxybenzoate polyprenyltransferase